MILAELNDQQVAGAFINQDPVQRRQDNAKTPQQLARDQAVTLAQEKTSTDPLARRISTLRAQLAQLIIQKQNQDKQQSKQQGKAPANVPGITPPQDTQ